MPNLADYLKDLIEMLDECYTKMTIFVNGVEDGSVEEGHWSWEQVLGLKNKIDTLAATVEEELSILLEVS